MKRFRVQTLLLIGSLILAAILRLLWLDRVPSGVGGDELTYILTSKFMALKGSDAFGSWNPWSIFAFHYPTGYSQAEITYFLLLPVVSFFPFTLETIKIFFALISLANVFLIFCIAYKLFGSRVAIIASYISAINPWFIFLGRTAYEMNPEVFFYLLAFAILLYTTRWKILFSLPIFLLAFYSHIASKTIFFPYVVATVLYVYLRNKKKYAFYYLCVIAAALLMTGFFVYTIVHQPASRLSELIRFDDPQITATVNMIRKTTLQNPLSSVYTNKFTVFIQILIAKFFTTLSPTYLFLNGDQFFSIYSHGLFYVVDALFLFLGILYLFLKQKGTAVFLSLMLLLTIIPHLIHSTGIENFTPQVSLFFPFAILIISNGISYALSTRLLVPKLSLILVVILYSISLGNFINTYFFQFPFQESFDFRMRVVSRYINLSNQKNIVVYTPSPSDIFGKYIFYSHALTKNSVAAISWAYKTMHYAYGPVTFLSCSDDIATSVPVIVDVGCKQHSTIKPTDSITRLVDAGATFEIVNDPVCQGVELTKYPTNVRLSDFSVEHLSTKEFCEKYIH